MRKNKLIAETALTDDARAAARRRVRATQAQIRDHVENTGVFRQRYREQLRLGHTPPPGQAPAPPDLPPTPRPTLGTTTVPAPAASPTQRVRSGDFAALQQVGDQRGSNPGGLYETADGSRWYVKELPEDRARSEALATALYREAGIDAPQVVLGREAPGLPGGQTQIASRIVANASAVTGPDQIRDQMRQGFAVDAWLANWDVAGASWDNVVTAAGRVWRIDAGGSLRFRAQGGPKGDAFGPTVNEWLTLRDPATAPQAAQAFRGTPPGELVAAVERVEAVRPERIRDLVSTQGLDDDLAELLVRRRRDIVNRLPTLQEQTRRHEAYERARASAAQGQDALDVVPHRLEHAPPQIVPAPDTWTPAQAEAAARAASYYQGSGYDELNNALREAAEGELPQRVRDSVDSLDQAIDSSHLPDTVLAHRGFSRPEQFIAGWNSADVTGVTWTEYGYSSLSADSRVAAGFAGGGVVTRVVVPSDTPVLRLSDMAPQSRPPSGIGEEAEIVGRRDITYRVVADRGVDETGRRILDVEIVQQ